MKSLHRVVLLAAPLLLLAVGCFKKAGPSGPPAAPVLVAKVIAKTVPVQIRAIGTVEPYATVSIKAQINGQVTEVLFRDGQDVKKGDPLFTIDPRPFAATLKSAEAMALKARNNLERNRKLLEDHTISQQEYDDAVATAQDAEAALDRARLDLQYCSITAPIDGRTSDVMVNVGNLVKANDNPVLVTINQLTPIYVSSSVPEQYLPDIRKFMATGTLKVQATVQGTQAQTEEGELTFIDNTVEKATGTIRLKATFANAERRLWPGQFVDVALRLTEEPNALTVPSEAIQTGQNGQYVYVVKSDKTAELRPVTVGRTVGSDTVIEKGVQADDTVVTDGQLRVVPGGKVEIKTGLQ